MITLPRGWEWATVADLCDVNPRQFNEPLEDDDELSVVPMASVEAETGRMDPSKTARYGDVRPKSLAPFQNGDVVFAKITPCMENGKIALASGLLGGRALGSTELFVLRTRGAVEPRYLMYYLLQTNVRRAAERNMSGAVGQRRVPRPYLEGLPIPLPPLPEQQRIVGALDDHLSRLEAASGTLVSSLDRLNRQVRAIYTAASEGRLVRSNSSDGVHTNFQAQRLLRWNEQYPAKPHREPLKPNLEACPVVPEGWRIYSLDAVTDPARVIRYGILMPRVKSGGEVPYVEVKDLAGCSLAGKPLHSTSRELDEQFAGARIQPGDVLLAVRGSYERSAIVPEGLRAANISRDVARLAPLEGLDPRFLQLFLQSRFAQSYFAKHARGVAVKGINIKTVREMPIAVPSSPIQELVADEVERMLSVTENLINSVEHVWRKGVYLRDSILANAFAGRLVPQSPEDEPASMLLKRIEAEHKESTEPRRSRRSSANGQGSPQ